MKTFYRFFRGKILPPALAVAAFAAQAGAQQLYISRLDTWFHNDGTGAYCNDVTAAISVPVSGAVAGTLTGTINGTAYEDVDDGWGNCISNEDAENVTITGAYASAANGITGTLTGFDNYASGNVSGNITGTVTGNSADAGLVTCTPDPNTFNTGNIYVYGTGPNGGTMTAPVPATTVTSAAMTCRAGPAVCTIGSNRWIASSPANDTVSGTIAGAVSGISNGPDIPVSFKTDITGAAWTDSALIEFERPRATYPGACLGLCASIVCVSTGGAFGIDDLTFEIFKFGTGSNPLDPSSTPPIKTISLFNIGRCLSANNELYRIGTFCTAWDGNYNLNGIFGKSNGQYGFRAKVKTNQVSATAGNISIEQTAAYPGEMQIPIQVNVTNIHTVRSKPTVVGKVTGVAAQPYNLQYRLSKDATVTIRVFDANIAGQLPLVRSIISNTPRSGEGTPDGTLTNGDFWDGRNNTGDIVNPGLYLAQIDAVTNDMWAPTDMAYPTTIQIALDPLQITDVAVKPLGVSSTDMATISYMLTEAATVYLEIYTPGTNFVTVNTAPAVPSSGSLLRRFVDQKDGRKTVSTYWDGRDSSGNPVCDGDYIYALYAVLPSPLGPGGQIFTKRTLVGTVPISRGNVLTFMAPSSTVIGSTQQVAGLDPFYFRYTPIRDAYVSLNIKRMDGEAGSIVRNVVTNEMRFANFSNREIWDGKDNNGIYVSSGSYLAELITTDPFLCASQKTSTVTAVIPVHMFRVVDVRATSLMGGTSDMARITFEMSQPMYMKLNIYPVSTVVNPSVWPPNIAATPEYTVEGIRPGRFRITEYWDGRNISGRLVDDGRYPFTLVAYTTGTAQVMYATDKVYGYVDVSRGKIIFSMFDVIPTIPTMYNSSDTITLPPYEIEYVVTRQAKVTVQILDNGVVRSTVTNGEVRDGGIPYQDFWDGKDDNGNFVEPSGDNHQYNVRVMAQDIDAQLASMATVQMTINVDPLRIYDVSIVPLTLENAAVVSYQISEPMKVVTKIFKPGTALPVNSSDDPPRGLVKRIIGVRPSRTQISEYWDGTDLTLAKVADGNYVFKIYASTVTDAISSITGEISNEMYRVPDIVSSNIPVTRGGTSDLCGDFINETFFAPNPYTGSDGWFRIPVIMNGWVSLKVYNIAGDLVYKKNFGDLNGPRDGGNNVDGNDRCVTTHTHEACWPKVNSYGRTVAPGVYFAVIRFEATEGTRDVCQTIKKILIP